MCNPRIPVVSASVVLFLTIGAASIAGETNDEGVGHPILKGPYLGQHPPGDTPQVFAPGFVSTDEHEFSCTFTPDGKEFYFARGTGPHNRKRIMVTRLEGGVWTVPEVALPAFASENFEPRVTPDGKRLFFMGFHETAGGEMPAIDMFYAERTAEGWGEVHHLGEPFNSAKSMFVSATSDGTIYTTDAQAGEIVRSRLVEGEYQPYENLGPPVNTDGMEIYPYVDPDESFLIYNAMGSGESGLVVSFRADDGSWTGPQVIDTGMHCGCPTVSPDGKYLFFVSGRPKGDLYWVDMKIVHSLKPQDRN